MAEPYAQVARYYDAEYDAYEADVRWFSQSPGRGLLLVGGCGTGRVSRRLAASRSVVGLDRSEAMLAVARQRTAGERYVVGDLRTFDVGPLGEVLIPNASFNFLLRRSDQAACLEACARALPPGGLLTLDLPMPDFARWAERRLPEKPAWRGEVDGRAVRRTRETTRQPELQRLNLLDRFYDEEDGALLATSLLELRMMLPGEVEWMLEAQGFEVEELVGDYAGRPLREGSPRILVRARRCG